MKWQKKLTKKELAHVKDSCGGTILGIKRTREHHRKMLEEFPTIEPCFECKHIAIKLGLE